MASEEPKSTTAYEDATQFSKTPEVDVTDSTDSTDPPTVSLPPSDSSSNEIRRQLDFIKDPQKLGLCLPAGRLCDDDIRSMLNASPRDQSKGARSAEICQPMFTQQFLQQPEDYWPNALTDLSCPMNSDLNSFGSVPQNHQTSHPINMAHQIPTPSQGFKAQSYEYLQKGDAMSHLYASELESRSHRTPLPMSVDGNPLRFEDIAAGRIRQQQTDLYMEKMEANFSKIGAALEYLWQQLGPDSPSIYTFLEEKGLIETVHPSYPVWLSPMISRSTYEEGRNKKTTNLHSVVDNAQRRINAENALNVNSAASYSPPTSLVTQQPTPYTPQQPMAYGSAQANRYMNAGLTQPQQQRQYQQPTRADLSQSSGVRAPYYGFPTLPDASAAPFIPSMPTNSLPSSLTCKHIVHPADSKSCSSHETNLEAETLEKVKREISQLENSENNKVVIHVKIEDFTEDEVKAEMDMRCQGITDHITDVNVYDKSKTLILTYDEAKNAQNASQTLQQHLRGIAHSGSQGSMLIKSVGISKPVIIRDLRSWSQRIKERYVEIPLVVYAEMPVLGKVFTEGRRQLHVLRLELAARAKVETQMYPGEVPFSRRPDSVIVFLHKGTGGVFECKVNELELYDVKKQLIEADQWPHNNRSR
eukprot:GHVH01007854.1.p1 GENE.GHVH01007854.1~~GHVH01007854.1.p1  ORF type:complete len:643 (-),score=90.45 GHVH01007854.1:112-2040(-)